MSHRGKFTVLILSGVIAGFYIVGGLPVIGRFLQTSAQQVVNDPNAQIRIVESVLGHIQNDYVDEPNMEKVRVGALRGLVEGLDPYSSFLTADQVKAFEANASAGRAGLGVEFSRISGYLYVISSPKGSPAERAGIKNGDVIEYIEGKATRDLSLYDSKMLTYGDAGSSVSLRILRAGSRPQTIKVTRGEFRSPAPEVRMEAGKTAVVKLFSAESGQADAMRTVLADLAKQGVQKVALDIRGLASGTIDESAAITNLFIKDGSLATIVGKENKILRTLNAEPAKAVFDGQVVVLTDSSTAGPGEIIASAFAERKRGEVVGEKTFGGGVDQKLIPMKSGEGVLLTVAKWASASGKPFLGDERANTGVAPTVEVKRSDSLEPLEVEALLEQSEEGAPTPTPTPGVKQAQPSEDLQLKKALELLNPAAKAATN